MRSAVRSYGDMVLASCRTNVNLQRIVDGIGRMALADIEQIPQPPWIREGLVELKKRQQRAETLNRLNVAVDEGIVIGFNDPGMGEMREWRGPRQFVKIGNGEVEIEPGHLLWLPVMGGVWFETKFGDSVPPELISNSISCGTVSKADYHLAYRAAISKAHQHDGEIIDLVPSSTQPFRIIRK